MNSRLQKAKERIREAEYLLMLARYDLDEQDGREVANLASDLNATEEACTKAAIDIDNLLTRN